MADSRQSPVPTLSVAGSPASDTLSDDVLNLLPKGATITQNGDQFVISLDVSQLDSAAIKNKRLKQIANNGFYYINENPRAQNTANEKLENFHVDAMRLLKIEDFDCLKNTQQTEFYQQLYLHRHDINEQFISTHYSQGILTLSGDFLVSSITEELQNENVLPYTVDDNGRKAIFRKPTEGVVSSVDAAYPVTAIRKNSPSTSIDDHGVPIAKDTLISPQYDTNLDRGFHLKTIQIKSPELVSALYATYLVVGNAMIDKTTYDYAVKNKNKVTSLASVHFSMLRAQWFKKQTQTQTKVAKSLALTSIGGFALIAGAAIAGTALFIAAAPVLTIGAIAALPVAATVAVGIGGAVAAVGALAFVGGVIAAAAYGIKYYFDSKKELPRKILTAVAVNSNSTAEASPGRPDSPRVRTEQETVAELEEDNLLTAIDSETRKPTIQRSNKSTPVFVTEGQRAEAATGHIHLDLTNRKFSEVRPGTGNVTGDDNARAITIDMRGSP